MSTTSKKRRQPKNRYFKIIQVPNIFIIVKKCVSMIDKVSYHTGVIPDNN